MKTTILIAVTCAALAGCATKQFAQVGELTNFEKTSLSCREIDIEMAKTRGVQQKIAKQDEFDARSVLAFLGDWGIGNAMAKSSAEEGAAKRMSDLQGMRDVKNCPESTTAARGQAS